MIERRPARESDRELLWLIQSTSLRPAVEATWGWDESLQRSYFDERYGKVPVQIIQVNGQDAGMLSYEVRPDHVFLRNVALLPAFQGQGIGTKVIRAVMTEAAGLGVPLRLQVLKTNRARRLYERLGFRTYAQTATHFQMSEGDGGTGGSPHGLP
jgi:ribosomal protein S18 acetylase RimI-like enzyme